VNNEKQGMNFGDTPSAQVKKWRSVFGRLTISLTAVVSRRHSL
jgi:hypothetical protein